MKCTRDEKWEEEKKKTAGRSAVEEVGGHEKLEGDLGSDGELGYLRGAVGVLDLVGEVDADLLQNVARYLAEVYLVRLVLGELAGPAEHGLDGAGRQGVLALDDELVAVGRDELDVHGVGACG